MICHELERPGYQDALARQAPVYANNSYGGVDVMTLDPESFQAQQLAVQAGGEAPHANESILTDAPAPFSGAACLQLVRADVEAYVATQRTNRDHEIDVNQFLENVYRPPDEKKVIHSVNDGLNRQVRGNRPPRERPSHMEEPRYDNYWQARYVMELINDAIAEVENSNGGKLKPSKIFKRLDIDNDGFISLSDLKSAFERYKIPATDADLHAAFTCLDKQDNGSINIGEFTRNYEIHQGSMLENMQKPIRSVLHEGGVDHGGPVQDRIEAYEADIMRKSGTVEGKETTGPLDLASPASSRRGRSAPSVRSGIGSDRAGSMRSGLSNTGSS